jgi:exodeoxyribonuclease V gamma subunit
MSVRLVTSQRTEALVDALAEAIDARRALVGPLEPTHVIVPSANLERHLVLALAERRGVAANLRFHRLERFVGRWIARERIDVARVVDRRALEAFVLAALLDDRFLATDAAGPLARYVGDGDEDSVARDRRRVQLALRLARLLEGYAYSRPETLRAWERRDGARRDAGGDPGPRDVVAASDAMERWQRALWCEVRARAASRGVVPLHEALARLEGRTPTPGALPATLHVVGLSYVARIFQWVFGAMGARTDLSLYVLNPCREFWEDVAAESELRARLEEPTEVLDREDDPPMLTWWGRPGREHVHLLGELTGGDREERFDAPPEASDARGSLLARVQDDVLERRAFPVERVPADGTIAAFACPGVRREVEAVAEEIWRLVRASRADAPLHAPGRLRFHEIAVLVHADDRDTYLPHVAAVFGQARRIPHHVVDLSLQSESRVVEAASLLVDVLLSRFSRPEVLALLRHPALRVPGASTELDRAAWARIVDRLGVFHGRDGEDLAGTYLAPETLGFDAVSWAQAASRLALGAFLECETDPRPFESATGPIHPEPGEADEATPSLALIVRSLIADARFAETAELPLSAWAVFFEALFTGYLEARGEREESELRRCLAACRAIAEREVGADVADDDAVSRAPASVDAWTSDSKDAETNVATTESTTGSTGAPTRRVARVRVHVAAELLREGLASLGGARGEYLADGVVVSALAPMRAIPFRVVFLLGMGEGRFPTSERRDPLDLRAHRRRLGDVTPAERDKYVFLETLLCARERFVVSWVARDELTGEVVAPSPVVVQLLELLQRRYVAGGELVRTFPLRRHDEPHEARAIREATLESLAYRAGEALHHAAGRAVTLDEVRVHGGPLAELLVVHERLDEPRVDAPTRDAERSVRAPDSVPMSAAERARGTSAVERSDDDELVVSLSALRRFLSSPLRGWASAVLRLEREDDDEARAALEDEPFRPSALDRADALREAFEEGLRRRVKPEEWHEREGVPLRQAHGRWPLGTVAGRSADADRRMLGGWRRLFAQTVARAGMTPRRVRFGASVEIGESDVVRDPIVLPNARVVGRTSLLFEDERASLVLLAKEPPQGAELRRERLRHALDGFVDYVALVAGGGGPRDSHRALVLYGGDAAVDASTRFGPLDPDEARRWLVERARELRGEPHDVFLPFEAVARVLTSAEGWRGLTRGALTREVEAERRRRRNAPESWRAGLVRDEHTLRVPDEVDVVVRRRFGLFVRLAGLDVGGGS